MESLFMYIFIFILPVISSFIALIGTFMQTLPFMENSSIFYKILTSEFWATLNVLIYIPYLRLANKYLNPAQLLLYGYLTSFGVQIFSNKYMFISPTSYDDYFAMVIMFIAMGISAYKVFN
uniref:Uncharacterized protein n=1 Tax=viral metagenome TaxID=1070528 RepID=A0A6C0DTY4_9ZZZZ